MTLIVRPGQHVVVFGSIITGAVVDPGGALEVRHGTTVDTLVKVGGKLDFVSGGTDIGTQIYGTEVLQHGSTATGDTVFGVQQVGLNSVAIDTIVNGLQEVTHGGLFDDIGITRGTIINSGGVVLDGGITEGTTINSGGLELVQSAPARALDTKINGGTLEVQSGGALGGTTTFTSAGGHLVLDDIVPAAGHQQASVVIAGFGNSPPGVTENIDLRDLDFLFTQARIVSNDKTSSTLEIRNHTEIVKLTLIGTHYSSDDFHVSNDGHGGTLVTFIGIAPNHQAELHL